MKLESAKQKEEVPFVILTLTKEETKAYRDLIGFSNEEKIIKSGVDNRITHKQYGLLYDMWKELNSFMGDDE